MHLVLLAYWAVSCCPSLARGSIEGESIKPGKRSLASTSADRSALILAALGDLANADAPAPGGLVGSASSLVASSGAWVRALQEETTCGDYPGWVDDEGNGCGFWNGFCSAEGVNGTEEYVGTDGLAPNEACCKCGGGYEALCDGCICPAGSYCPDACFDTGGVEGVNGGDWFDGEDGCGSYEAYGYCPKYGASEFAQGPANDHCCACGGGAARDIIVPCAAGTYNPDEGSTSIDACRPCSAGTFNPDKGATSLADCIACSSGSYCPAGSDGEILCPAGSYCPSDTVAPIQCPIGTTSQEGAVTETECVFDCMDGSNSLTDTLANGILLQKEDWSCPTFSSEYDNNASFFCASDVLLTEGLNDAAFSMAQMDFVDPAVSFQAWYLRAINADGAWRLGATGTGVNIVVVDDGLDIEHPDFAGRFNEEGSSLLNVINKDTLCDERFGCVENFRPSEWEWAAVGPIPRFSEDTHGTFVAGYAAAAKNDACGVGVAFNATLSWAHFLSPDRDSVFSAGVRNGINDVSINSWGLPSCKYVGLEDETVASEPTSSSPTMEAALCPFVDKGSTNAPWTPCDVDECDWRDDTSLLNLRCRKSIKDYCLDMKDYENAGVYDPACADFWDLFIDCTHFALDNKMNGRLRDGVTLGRRGKGINYVFAAGNAYNYGENANTLAYQSSMYVITVGATARDDKHAFYSTSGNNVFISAPGGESGPRSSGATGEMFSSLASVASVRNGENCRAGGAGTSYAAPLVGGVVALLLEVNPQLGWRDVQDILAHTARRVHFEDPSWTRNGAGLAHSNLYGFGVVDAGKAVALAQRWGDTSTLQARYSQATLANLKIAESTEGVRSVCNVRSEDVAHFLSVEHVVVYFTVDHVSRGDVEVELISPSGTRSLMLWQTDEYNPYSGTTGYESFRLMTLKNWGEEASGEWTLRVVDAKSNLETGHFQSWRLVLYGKCAMDSVGQCLGVERSYPSAPLAFIGGTYKSILNSALDDVERDCSVTLVLPRGDETSRPMGKVYRLSCTSMENITVDVRWRKEFTVDVPCHVEYSAYLDVIEGVGDDGRYPYPLDWDGDYALAIGTGEGGIAYSGDNPACGSIPPQASSVQHPQGAVFVIKKDSSGMGTMLNQHAFDMVLYEFTDESGTAMLPPPSNRSDRFVLTESECAPGSFLNFAAMAPDELCEACPPGTISSYGSLVQCSPCPAGRVASSAADRCDDALINNVQSQGNVPSEGSKNGSQAAMIGGAVAGVVVLATIVVSAVYYFTKIKPTRGRKMAENTQDMQLSASPKMESLPLPRV